MSVVFVWWEGCAPAPRRAATAKTDEAKAAAETISEVKKAGESSEARAASPKAAPRKDWAQTAKEDWGDFGSNLVGDVQGLWAREDIVYNGLIVGGATGLGLVSANNWDGPIRAYYWRHHKVLGAWQEVGELLGQPWLHFGVMGVMYAEAKIADDYAALETSKRLAEALALNGVTTLVLKYSVNRRRPNGSDYSFPSGHVSSAFAFAAVMDGTCGHLVGVPLYVLGGFVGFTRIEGRAHYLSDVICGAAMGYVFGRTAVNVHERKFLGFEAAPWVDPDTQAAGLMFQRRF